MGEIAERDEGGVPTWMKKRSDATLGNLDASDLKPPQLKLLQAMSPETAEQSEAKAGNFWLIGANQDRGAELIGTLIFQHKSFVLWNPMKSESKVPLAVASDAIHWDTPNLSFDVQFPNNPKVYTWNLTRTVKESGLDRFGSSRPEDPRSPPAASLSHACLWAFPRLGDRLELAVIINSRSGLKPVRELFAMIEARGVDHYYQRYRIKSVRLSVRPGEYFFGYKYFFEGLVTDREEASAYRDLYERYKKIGLVSDIAEEVQASGDDKVEVRRGKREFAPLPEDDEQIPFMYPWK